MEEKILYSIYESLKLGKKSAMIMLMSNEGSTPRGSGTIMAVFEDGSIEGTIGGGNIEKESIEEAVRCIIENKNGEYEFDLSDEGKLHMQCGGKVKVYIKVFVPKNKLIIIGAGHISIELYKFAKILGFNITIIDDRIEFANRDRFPEVDEIIVGNIGESIKKIDTNENTFIVIVTRGHLFDEEALGMCISRKYAYIGMIGSKHKTEYVIKSLIEQGINIEELGNVYAPIGLDIASEEPNEIALSIISEIMLIKNKGTLNHLKNIKGVNINYNGQL